MRSARSSGSLPTVDEDLAVGLPETPDKQGAYPRLEEPTLEALRGIGTVRTTASGETLFREGDAGYDLFVIKSGTVAIVAGHAGANRIVAVHGAGRFIGELGLLREGRAYLSAVVGDPGEVIQVPQPRVRQLVEEGGELASLLLGALLARREILIEDEAGVHLIGSRFSPQTRTLREYLARNRIPSRWSDLESDPAAEGELDALGLDPSDTPVVLAAGQLLKRPSTPQLARALGIGTPANLAGVCDLLVVGAGPAGLAAAVYGASEGLATQLVDGVAIGGQAGTSSRIENYLGFPNGISGGELAERAFLQAQKFGARIRVPNAATRLERTEDRFRVELGDGPPAEARAVIVATGARYRRLELPELDRFERLGVYYAAGRTEANLCAGSGVIVVGGGNSAGQAAIFLSGRAASCKLVIRGPELSRSMSAYLIDEIARRPEIEVLTETEVDRLEGGNALEKVILRHRRTAERSELDVNGLFVFIGADPHTEWLGGQVATDEKGFLLTGDGLQVPSVDAEDPGRPLFLETSVPGIFAVGDVRSSSIKRVASAAGEGAMAVRMVHQRLADAE